MTRFPLSAACLLCAALAADAAPATSPAEPVATGRERSPTDHEFYRTADPAPAPATPSPATTGAGRLAPTADEWAEAVRQWMAGFGF